MEPLAVLEYVFAGLVVGLLTGLTGVGAAVLMIPFLVVVRGFPPAQAVSIDLVYAAVTKVLGAVAHSRLGNVNRFLVRHLLYGSIPGVILAAAFLRIVHRTGTGGAIMVDIVTAKALALVLGVIALQMLRGAVKPGARSEGRGLPPHRAAPSLTEGAASRFHGVALLTSGAVVGFFIALTSVGSGSLVAAILAGILRLPAWEVAGVSIAYGALILPLAAVLHGVAIAAAPWLVLVPLLSGSLPGVWLGSRLSRRAPERVLRLFIGFVLLASAVRLW